MTPGRELLVADNLHVIGQGRRLVNKLDGSLYARVEPMTGSSIGGHVRHAVDHYTTFLGGFAQGRIDYDARERDVELETRPEIAHQRFATLARELGRLEGNPELEVWLDTRGVGPERSHSASTVDRELQFLLSHTVHHFALIAVILRLAGREAPRELGASPSTLRYWREERDPCAR